MSEVEATLLRIRDHKGVMGTIIVDNEGEAKRWLPEGLDRDMVSRYAELVPQLAGIARSMVRDLDPLNDLQFLRIRSKNHEIMVHSDPEFTLIVIQNPDAEE